MPYKNDRQLTLELLAIRAFQTLLIEGQDSPDLALIKLLDQAKADISIPPDRETKINRRAIRILNEIVAPFEQAEAPVAKFGLCLYYCLRELIDQNKFVIEPDSALDKFCEMLLSDDGSLVELANVEKLDASAQKQSKRMLNTIRSELKIGR